MRVLIFTSLCRLPSERFKAPFTNALVRWLQELAHIDLVCSIPWAPNFAFIRKRPKWSIYIGVPDQMVLDGQEVHFTKYPFLPRIGGHIQSLMQVLVSFRLIKRMHAERGIDVINGRFVFPDGVAAAWIGNRLGIPVVLTALGSDINVDATHWFRRWQIRWAIRRAAHITVVSNELGARVQELGAASDRVSCSPNGVDVLTFRPDGPQPNYLPPLFSGQSGRLVVVSRLVPGKGLDVLVAALALIRDRGGLNFQTTVVGDGPAESDLKAQVAALRLSDAVSFVGAVEHGEVPCWMRAATVFCLPSLREGTPNVVLEALASGVPVVATSVGGIPNVVDERNGILVEAGDAAALADAIEHAMQRKWDAQEVRGTVMHMSWRNEALWHMDVFAKAISVFKSGPKGTGASCRGEHEVGS